MANEQLNQRQRRVRWIWISAIAIAAAAILWAFAPRATEADLVTIDQGDVRVELVDEGRTRMHDVYVVSAPVSGRLLRVEVEPGDAVKAGAVIARMTQAAAGFLDTRSDLQARATVDAAAAQLRAADSDLALATREQARTRSMAEQKLVSAAALDTSQARLDASRATRDAAAAGLTRARSALLPAERMAAGTIAVRAPVDGDVLRVPQKSESVLVVGAPIVELGDPSHVEVIAEFLSQDAVRMRPGQTATIENWGGAPLAATVDRIEPVARTKISALGVEEQRTNVILQFKDQAQARQLGHDYRVDARVVVDASSNVVRAPLGALFRRGQQWSVYQVVGGRAVLKEVQVGFADSGYRVISQGLAAGDVVVLFPGSAISNGMRLRPRKTANGS
ncbi:MAG: efflux RND transporter periplasmic adaptor subunit [Pseudomonadota bacterium]